MNMFLAKDKKERLKIPEFIIRLVGFYECCIQRGGEVLKTFVRGRTAQCQQPRPTMCRIRHGSALQGSVNTAFEFFCTASLFVQSFCLWWGL